MVTRTKTQEECEATVLLLGPDWTYGIQSHTFFKGTAVGYPGVEEWRCAETMRLLSREECSQRRAQKRDEDNRAIQENIRLREEARTHATTKDTS